jgi:hypothetical protein
MQGKELPLIFAWFAELTFWAIATEILVNEDGTSYRFAHLCPIKGCHRNDLTLVNTGKPPPNNFIRSYALVKTPKFLVREQETA